MPDWRENGDLALKQSRACGGGFGYFGSMETPPTEKERMRQYLANWKAVSELMEEMNAEELRALTEAKLAEQFNGMDCDPAWYWTPDERIVSSGLIEQQRLFAKAHGYAPIIPRSA